MRRYLLPYLILSFLVTVSLAGLFYLPYMSVHTRTIDTFQTQQVLRLNKVVEGIEGYFSNYHRALDYLSGQRSVVEMDDVGRMLLEDFHAMHRSRINGLARTAADGEIVFSINSVGPNPVNLARFGEALPDTALNIHGEEKKSRQAGGILFTAPLFREKGFAGNISFITSFRDLAGTFIEPAVDGRKGRILLFSHGGTVLYPWANEDGESASGTRDRSGLYRLFAEVRQGQQGEFITETRLFAGGELSHKVYGVYLPVHLPGDKIWTLMMLSPEAEVLGTMTAFRKLWFTVTLITVLAVMLLSAGLAILQSKRQEENAHRRFEEQMVLMLEYAPMGVLLVTEKGVISYANRAVAEIVAVDSARSMDGKKLNDFIHPDDKKRFASYLEECSRDVAGEITGVKITGRNHRHRDAVISAVRMQVGSHVHYIIILQDVTETLKVEEVQRRLATAVDQVKELVIITDTRGRIVYINSAYCENSGYRREESLEKGVQMLWAKDNEPGLWAQVCDTLDRGNVWKGRIINRRKDGTTFVSASTISPVRNADGVIAHYVMVQRDVTHEVAFEARVQQTRKMEAIGTLAGGIAHDFNNILGAIIGFTDMALLQCRQESEVHDSLVNIRQAGKRAADLVHQILTFSRQSALEKSPVSVAPIIKESLNLIRASLPSTIAIDQRVLASESKVTAAPVQLQQIIMNLCTNAFYSMRDQGGTLTVTLEEWPAEKCGEAVSEGDTECVCLMVRDTGMGMEDAVLQRIFTPFFTTKEPGEGTGMGLSVVQGIVQDLGGDIQVKSVLGKGTTFFVYMPIAGEDQEEKMLSGEQPLPTGDEHIVVVDDEKEIRDTCSMMLKHFGYRVTTISEPGEVITMVEAGEEKIDLVITDHTMPGMTGLELTRSLQRIRPELPIILCTGYSDKLNYNIAINSGACDFMMKPVDLQELAMTVRAALDGTPPSATDPD